MVDGLVLMAIYIELFPYIYVRVCMYVFVCWRVRASMSEQESVEWKSRTNPSEIIKKKKKEKRKEGWMTKREKRKCYINECKWIQTKDEQKKKKKRKVALLSLK